MTTIHDKIKDDVHFALSEAFNHIQKFFGTPNERKKELRDEEPGANEDLKEDQELKPIAFKAILETLLTLYVSEPNGGKVE